MEDLQNMQNDVENIIERDQTNNEASWSYGNSCQRKDIKDENQTLRQKLDEIIHSHRFTVIIISLVALDCLMLIAQLFIDLERDKLNEHHHLYASMIFHYASLSILGLFLIEIGVRIFVLRLKFFHHKLELFDSIVVVVSFILDVVFRDHHDIANATGLLILLRLWRLTRIVNGIVLSVEKRAEEKLEQERQKVEMCEDKCRKLREYCYTLYTENENLQNLLSKHKITFCTNDINPPDGCGLVDIKGEAQRRAAMESAHMISIPDSLTDTSI